MTRPKANPKPSPWKKGIPVQGTIRCVSCGTIRKKSVTTCAKCQEVYRESQ